MLEPLWCSVARSNGRELDVAGVASRLAPRAAVAHGHAVQGSLAPHEDRVADSLLVRRRDLPTEIEPSEHLIRQTADLVQDERCAVASVEKSACGLRACGPIALAATTVRDPGQKPCF